MKKILKSSLLLFAGLCSFTACDDDNSENPVLQTPTTFVLNTPSLATNGVYDLANSTSLELTCSQPDYGFPAKTAYTVEMSLNSDMSNSASLSSASTSARIDADAAEMASTLTTLALNAGKTEADFPLTIPVYVRVNAVAKDYLNNDIAGSAIASNIVKLNSVRLLYSLPPVSVPDNLYITGNFNGWSWETALTMTQVNGAPEIFWHMVYIDGSGIKFNTAKAWDGNQVGFSGITVNASSELGGEIKEGSDGNIVSSTPGWYLMIVSTSVSGRSIVYDVTFNKPAVYLMGPVTIAGTWDELQADAVFEVPTTADGNFVSPAFNASVPGGDGDGVRAYVKAPGFDWWKSEFMVFDNKISYRGTGGDQSRVAGSKGQKLYLNFTKETGEIK